MNDLQTLHDAWGTPPAPSHHAYSDARAALLARADRRRRPRLRVRFAAAATVGAMAATFVLVVQNLGEAPRAVPTASAEAFERAAVAAEKKPFTPPRDNQWIYVADRITSSDGGKPMLHRQWKSVSGFGMGVEVRGGVKVIEPPAKHRRVRGPFDSYKALAALPTDPDSLLRWAYRQAQNVTGAGLTEDGDVYAILRGVLAKGVLPPDLEAGVFRTLERVPGVTVDTADVLGHRMLALALTEDWLRQELLLDPRTYAYRGER